MTAKIHAKLKWSTIIERINKKAGFEKFRVDQYGKVYLYHKSQNAFIFLNSILFDKQDFIDAYA